MGLLQRSITAGVLIAGILMLRQLASGKLSRKVFAALWKIAVLRLLLPFSFRVEDVFLRMLSFAWFRKNADQIIAGG